MIEEESILRIGTPPLKNHLAFTEIPDLNDFLSFFVTTFTPAYKKAYMSNPMTTINVITTPTTNTTFVTLLSLVLISPISIFPRNFSRNMTPSLSEMLSLVYRYNRLPIVNIRTLRWNSHLVLAVREVSLAMNLIGFTKLWREALFNAGSRK
jgi:hypothetical protein